MLEFIHSIFNFFYNLYPFKKVQKANKPYVVTQEDVDIIYKEYKYILPYLPQSGDKDAYSGKYLVGKTWERIGEIYCKRYVDDLNMFLTIGRQKAVK